MGTPKLSTFLIGLVWISFFAAMFGLITSNFVLNYGGTFDENQIAVYNKMSDLNSSVNDIQDSTLGIKNPTSSTADILGGFFSDAYNTVVIAIKSLDIFKELTFNALSDLNIPAMQYLKTSVFLTVVIIVVIGIMLSAIIKREM